MDLSRGYDNVRNSWPVRALGAVVAQSAQPVLRRMIGANLTYPEVVRRRAEMPVHKAELGALAVRQGMAARDSELLHFGGAMVLRAVDEAARVNDLIVQEAVAKVASGLPRAGLAGNPLIAPEVAEHVAEILDGAKEADHRL